MLEKQHAGAPANGPDRINGPHDALQGSTLTRREFMAIQLTPLMRGLVAMGTVGYVMLLAGTQWLGNGPLPLFPKLVVLALLVTLNLATLPATARKHVTLAGWFCTGLLQIGILLAGLYRAEAASWLLPGYLIVIVAASPTWLDSRDFIITMLLCLTGPAAAWWLMQPAPTLVVQATSYIVIALGVATVIHAFIQRQLNAQFALQKRLARIACTDALTGIANRMHFFALGNQLIAQSHQRSSRVCALFIDVDHFKSINDDYGHAAGDDALVAIAKVLESRMRRGDVLGRVGGEEFAMLLPSSGLENAAHLAERLRSAIENLDLSCGSLSISVGVAMLCRDDQSVNGVLAAADHALQRAKRRGRNRIEVAHADYQTHAPELHLVRDRRTRS